MRALESRRRKTKDGEKVHEKKKRRLLSGRKTTILI